MFFTSEVSIPFNNIYDVMKAYPTWKLKMRAGEEVRFQYKALDGDELYAEFYDRIINEPQEAVYQEVSDGMNLLKSESAVIQISEGSLKVCQLKKNYPK